MSGALLSTKFYIPPTRPDAVFRPRLVEKLRSGLHLPGRLTLISGPAGYGKTTLLSEFVTQLDIPAAWVSLDEGDSDPVWFWRYVIAACQSVYAGIGAPAQEMLKSPQPLPPAAIPTILINDFTSLNSELVLILDDYHTIQNETVQSAFLFLLEHLPEKLHIVVSTRVDPPWPLARFRARSQLTEVRARDLRFTTDEAASFLNRMMGLNLTLSDVIALDERAEGWIAALQLAALSMQGRSDTASFIRAFTGSHVYVAEYLLEEVLNRQPEDLQEFLLQTSILKRLNAELCNAVTGRQDGQEMLVGLNRANLFVLDLDDEGKWFRYHHLFVDLLQARFRQQMPADTTAELHNRAAVWYEQHGFIAEAINHRLAAKDFHEAARLIGENAKEIIIRGELSTLLRWTEMLPSAVLQNHPAMMMAKIWALTLAGDVRLVEPLLQLAEAYGEGNGESPAALELSGFAAAIRSFFAMMAGDDSRALELAERAEKLLPEHVVHARWLLPYIIGTAHRGQGQFDKAAEAFAHQAELGEEFDNLMVWATGVTAVALVLYAQGRLRATSDTCFQALQKLADLGKAQSGALAKLEVPLVEVLIEQNKLEEAEGRLAGVMRRMQHWPMPTDRLHAQLAQIELQMAQGDLPGAAATLRTAAVLKSEQAVIRNLARRVDLLEIRLSLESGDLASAERLMDALQPGSSRWVELRDQELLLFCRLRLAQGSLDEVERALFSLASDAEAGDRIRTLIETLALQACVFQAQDKEEAALAVLIRALALAEPEGYVRPFVVHGEPVQKLLAGVMHLLETDSNQASQPSKTYVAKLLGAFPARPEPGARASAQSTAADLVEQLSPRETEVLHLIAAGDSNQTVAEKLVITLSAVKKHTANIYGKLNVNSRTQAVARARQLGLLDADE